MKVIFSLISLIILISCTKPGTPEFNSKQQFEKELSELQNYFKIPGLAALVEKEGEVVYKKYFGYADVAQNINLDSTYLFPIASLTKVFSGTLIMRLVEQGKLSLDDSVNKFFPEPVFGDSILVKHLLSHTSQGEVGEHFYYSYRFGLLTKILEIVSGKPFDLLMEDEIFSGLALKNTYPLIDSSQLAALDLKIAQPYFWDNEHKPGFIDFGFSTSAGILSNLDDLLIFSRALDTNILITEASKQKMYTPFKKGSAYGFGIFSKYFDGRKMVWAYGQYDCYSSLLLKIPSEKLTLILLANNNLMSDPARLIYGDATSSLFALSFLKNYSYKNETVPLLEEKGVVKSETFHKSDFYRKKLLAQALADAFMARFETEKMNSSIKLLEKVFAEFPEYEKYADLNLLHNLSFLKDIAFYKELEAFNDFDQELETIGTKLLKEDPFNPYANIYMATFYDRKGHKEKAKFHFEQILKAENFSPFWYTSEAKNWLTQH